MSNALIFEKYENAKSWKHCSLLKTLQYEACCPKCLHLPPKLHDKFIADNEEEK